MREGFCDGQIHIGPITLRPRFTYTTAGPTVDAKGENGSPTEADPRQRELITAAWTAGTLANLLGREQVASVTFFETVGCKGLLAGPDPLPAAFGAQPGELFPVYHVFLALAEATKLLDAGRDVECAWLCFDGGDRQTCALMANLQPEISQLHFRAPIRTELVDLKLIDSHGGNARVPIVSEGFGYRLVLPPYAVAVARFS